MSSRKLIFKVNMIQCGACLGAHAHWWYNSKAEPPSCKERQEKMK